MNDDAPHRDAHASRANTLARPRTAFELFTAFTLLALQGFGGVVAIAQREFVERRRWLTREEFVELYSLSQMLPGPNVVNMSLILGDRYFGWRGAAWAVTGMLLIPILIVLALAASYNRLADVPQISGALRGMGAVAAGLMLATGIRLAATLRDNVMGPVACVVFGILTAVLVAVLRLPLVWVVPGLGLAGWSFARWCIARKERGG